MFAVQTKNDEVVNQFFNSALEVDNKHLNSLLCVACSKTGNEEIIELLIEKGADVNAYNEDGMPALMLACTSRTDDTKPVEILIKHGADINAVNKITKQNALFYAVQNNNYSIAEYLLVQGINVDDLNRTNAFGNTMLHTAGQFNKYKFTEDLIKRGADINKKRKQ